MIVGAQKAGTTSLKHYLGEHPQLQTHPQKEFSYFTDPHEYARGFNKATRKYFIRPETDKLFVAKNALLYSNMGGLERLYRHNPQVKLVFILRHPVERTYSAYLMERNAGSVREPFSLLADLVREPEKNEKDWRYALLVGMSRYTDHLRNIYSIFPKENLVYMLFDEFKNDPSVLCKKCFSMLGVDDSFMPGVNIRYNETKKVSSHTYARILKKLLRNENPLKKMARGVMSDQTAYGVGEMLRNVNRTSRNYPEMDEETRKILIEYFKPYNDRLSQMTGLDLSFWNE
ncbi:MAG: sulfotransferase [Bacteroidetes bacterium]|nr:sulfotransferase [Bacteroidota bacterium]